MKTVQQILEENSTHATTIIEHAWDMTHLYAIQSIIMILMHIASIKFGIDVVILAKKVYDDIAKEANDENPLTFDF